MKRLIAMLECAVLAGFLVCVSPLGDVAEAQWQVPADTLPLGRGVGTGFKPSSLMSGSDSILFGKSGAAANIDFIFRQAGSATAVIQQNYFQAYNSSSANTTYAQSRAITTTVTAGSEAALFDWWTVQSGTLAQRLLLGGGLYTPGSSGGDKGTDTFNPKTLYLNGVQVPAKLSANTTFYLRPSGSDSNCDGQTNVDDPGSGTTPRACAWQTVTGAKNNLCTSYDFNGKIATVQFAAGTYTGAEVNCRPTGLTSAAYWVWQGDTTTPSNVIIAASSGAYAMSAENGAAYTLDGLTFRNAAGNQDLVVVGNGSEIRFNRSRLGPLNSPSSFNQIIVYPGGRFIVPSGASYTIEAGSGSNGGQTHLYCSGYCFYETDGNPSLITVTIAGAVSYSVGFIYANGAGEANLPAITWTGSANVTGPRYYAEFGGTIYVASNVSGAEFSNDYNYLPGTSAGTTASNGRYVTNEPIGAASTFTADGHIAKLIAAAGTAGADIKFQNELGQTFAEDTAAATTGIVTWIQRAGHQTGNDPYLQALGETNTGMRLSTQGTGAFRFFNNAFGTTLATLNASGLTLGVGEGYHLQGATSGTISILPQSVAGTYNFNLPTTAGSSGQVLTSAGGSGSPMTWTNPVTSIATTSPISGGTITTTGTISCPTCVTSAASLTANAIMIGAGSQASAVTTTGTGVLTALAVNVGSAGAFVTFNGALGTPSSGTLTNATGLPVSTGISGLGTGVATWLATPSSANLISAVTDETGTGALVFANTPTLTTPDIGAATGTSLSLSSTSPLSFTGTSATIALNSGSGNNTLNIRTRGSGVTNFQNESSETYFQIAPVATSGIVNYMQWVGNVTGQSPYVSAQGSDTNVGMTFISKASGRVLFQTDASGDILFYAGSTIGTFTSSGLAITGLVSATTSIKSSGATSGIGYATGAGGTVTQATDKSTAVTLNKVTGAITMNNAALSAATIVSFTLNNSAIVATDHIIASHESGGTTGAYTVNCRATGSGTAACDVRNNTAGSLSEAIVIRFSVIKSVNSYLLNRDLNPASNDNTPAFMENVA